MDLPDIARHLPSQLGPGADTLTALMAFAAYPLFLARVLFKTRLLDFRAPDYADKLPDTDPATLPAPANVFELWAPGFTPPRLCTASGTVPPDRTYRLRVRLSARDASKIDIGLFRFKPPGGTPLYENDTFWNRKRVKSIILLNGFAQNTRAFVAPELGDQALASRLHAQGWDVWLFEYRVSPLLRASARFSSMDDIAAYDIPRAVRLVRRTVERELGLTHGSSQVFAFSHCVGSASLAMSVLGGHLAHWERQPGRGNDRAVPWLAGVLFSQFHPLVIGSETAQQRLQVGSLLHNVLQQDMLNFTARQAKADLLHAMMDRLFASAPYAFAGEPAPVHRGERCPGEHNLFDHRCDSTTCKRMTGVLSRLFNHAQLHEQTHRDLDEYFGRTNLGVFLHGARCVEHERLVSENGQNVYVTDKKMGRYLTMPVMLLHGKDNVLFDHESLGRTAAQLRRVAGGEFTRPGPPSVTTLALEGFAHFDCTIGKDAPGQVFGGVLDFFDHAFAHGGHGAQPADAMRTVTRSIARVPRTGPIVGWVRKGSDGGWLLRVWFEADLTSADRACCGLTRLRLRAGGTDRVSVQSWRLAFTPPLRESGAREPQSWLREASVGYCIADLEVPGDVEGAVTIEALTVHRFMGQPPAPCDDTAAQAAGLPAWWGVPLALPEIERDLEDPPWQRPGTQADHTGHLPQPAGAPPTPGVAHTTLAGPIANLPLTHLKSAFGAEASLAAALGDEAETELGPLPLLVQASADLAPDAFEVMLATARSCEAAADRVARRTEPGTLSRQRRKLSAIDGLRVQWSPPGDGQFRFLAAACRHPGITHTERDRADLALHAAARQAEGARFMLMLGDQIYADARAGLFDSASEIERLVPRYRDAFGSPGFRALAGRLPLTMLIDDHEIGDDWSVEELRTPPGRRRFVNALRAYQAFQRSHGPAVPSNGTADAYFEQDGVWFFLLDTRTNRQRGGQGRVMRAHQWMSLYRALKQAQATQPDTPKIICSGSVLAPGLASGQGDFPPRSVDTWQHSRRERQLLLGMLDRLGVRNAVLLSSDYHCSAAADIRLPSGTTVVALCAPPLHAPLVFANSQPDELLTPSETLPLRGNDGPSAEIWPVLIRRGDGWLDCRLARDGAGWRLEATFHLRDMLDSQAAGRFVPEFRSWRLGGPVQACPADTARERLHESA
jgi:hypothetical protein